MPLFYTKSMPSEREILDLLRRRRVPAKSGIQLGIGDDCAVYRPKPKEELVFTTDLLIEDVHFRWATHTAAQIGWNTLARGLSDIAAMGAKPVFCLLSLALSARADKRWVRGFYSGLLRLADETGTVLAGGDLARDTKVHCDIVVCGTVPQGGALRRSRARPGDRIFVSGLLGGSALGLAIGAGAAWKRHLRIEPRLRLGQFLRTRLKATACMDLSDGLSLDLHRLCLESVVSAAIVMPPRFPGSADSQVLHGGEDYELLFTVPPRTRVPAEFEDVPLTEIGTITAGHEGRVVLEGRPLKPDGFDHFQKAKRSEARSRSSQPTGKLHGR